MILLGAWVERSPNNSDQWKNRFPLNNFVVPVEKLVLIRVLHGD
jgi:hypothetical protein